MHMFMIACILKEESINLAYIIIKRMIKVWSNKTSTLVYSNLFTKLFKREMIKLSDETKNIPQCVLYDIYSEKTLGNMSMVKCSGGYNLGTLVQLKL